MMLALSPPEIIEQIVLLLDPLDQCFPRRARVLIQTMCEQVHLLFDPLDEATSSQACKSPHTKQYITLGIIPYGARSIWRNPSTILAFPLPHASIASH